MLGGTLSSTQHPALQAALGPRHSSEVEVLGAASPVLGCSAERPGRALGTRPGQPREVTEPEILKKQPPNWWRSRDRRFSKKILFRWKSSSHQTDDVGTKSKVSGRAI